MNVYKVTMRWLLVVKDHFTGLTYLAAIPKKRVSFMAHELCVMFGLCGYPSILHTDNGTEFTSKEIVAAVKELNEQILMVTCRPRKPSDQGSVESHNKLLKHIIKPKYMGVSQNLVAQYIEGCPGCLMKNHGVQKLKGAAEPISSYQFHDQFQVDFVDF